MTIEDIRLRLADAYWVLPDGFLAGPYPRGWHDEVIIRKLDALLEADISLFINLTEPGEARSYVELLYKQADVYGKEVVHWNAPIIDWGTTTIPHMIEILDRIDEALKDGKCVYVHCLGGIGRTGTVVGCYLVRHGMHGEPALRQIAEWRKDIPAGRMRSPESDDQRNMVLNWQLGK